jgi:hypothetical protein
VKLTTHLPSSYAFKNGEAKPPLPHTSSRCGVWSTESRATVTLTRLTGWTTEESQFDSWQENFLFSNMSRLALRLIQSPVQWLPGAACQGIKRLGREDDHFTPSSIEVKNGGAIRLHGVVLNYLESPTFLSLQFENLTWQVRTTSAKSIKQCHLRSRSLRNAEVSNLWSVPLRLAQVARYTYQIS